jgi:protein O-GlcNAc transferase
MRGALEDKHLNHEAGQASDEAASRVDSRSRPRVTPLALDRLVAQGQQLQQGGRLKEASEAYRRILAVDPDHAEAYHLLGLLMHQVGSNAEAAELIGKAVALAPGDATYRSNLGVVLKEAGRLEEAVISYEAALRIDPGLAQTHSNLGVGLLGLGRVEDAIAAQHRALALMPDYSQAHANLGLALVEAGRIEEAVESYHRAIALKPDYANAHNHLGAALKALGRFDAAEASCRKAIELRPMLAAAHHNLGSVLMEMGRLEEAVESYRVAVKIKPDGSAYRNLGNVLNDLGRYVEAMVALRSAIAADPQDSVAHSSLGLALQERGQSQQSVASFRRAVELDEDSLRARQGLAGALLSAGQIDEAIAQFRILSSTESGVRESGGGLLFAINYVGDLPVSEMVAEAKAYGRAMAQRHAARTTHTNAPDPDKRLRVGIVSGDLRTHAVARFLASVLAEVDPGRVELFAYSMSPQNDSMTARLKMNIPNWRHASAMTDDDLDQMVVTDAIDILIDLSGHSARSRLTVFARKPAPIAVTWLGYFATTGLKAIDYVLANRFVIPEDEEDQWVEKPWRLPETYLCFSPPSIAVTLAEPPGVKNGFVTFGSANNLNKLNDRTLKVWAQVLTAVPNSKLLLRSGPLADALIVAKTQARFAAHGIDVERLELEGAVSEYGEHLANYNRMDIALDPFPYAGGTTSVESLWMGVPVLTLKGDRYVAHMGENILQHVQLPDWIAETTDEYVLKAAAFAGNLDALADLRANLRERLIASPLCDAPRFARNLEEALRGMWARWCESQATSAADDGTAA